MNEINIISSDARYVALNEIFLENGYKSRLCTESNVGRADVLILPIRSTLADGDFSKIFRRLKKSALVFCGQADRVRRFFDGTVINYSADDSFLDRNAYITAECALALALNRLEKTLSESKCAIVGYGRIGKYLARMLNQHASSVTVFARREQSRCEAEANGCKALPHVNSLSSEYFDIIFNTVPEQIISKEISDRIPKRTLVYDLASLPGGFEDESYPERAPSLPGKMMPISAARAIFDFVREYVPNERN